MKLTFGVWAIVIFSCFKLFSQVDSAFLYNPNASYGALDIRIARSATNYYYLNQNQTFSFREVDGSKTNSYFDMTAWNSGSYQQGNLRVRDGSADQFVMNYRLLIPAGYDVNFSEGYPLVIMMHGRLERGNCAETNCYHGTREYSPLSNTPPAPTNHDSELLNNDYNLNHGGLNYLQANQQSQGKKPDDPSLSARAFPGFVLFPQNLNGWDENAAQDAIRIIRLLIKKYNINENKIFINGISNGGHGAYEAMKRAPWLFTAAALFSAADDASIVQSGLSPAIATIPMWIFQGGEDTSPTPRETEDFVRSFRSSGASVRYTLYNNLGHGTWNAGFEEPDFFSWMLGKSKSDIHVFADNSGICPSTESGVPLILPSGYSAYEWEFNGNVIEGATESKYEAKIQGSYRARYKPFSNTTESPWNKWSDVVQVTTKAVPTSSIDQTGTVLLRDLNGLNEAQLKSSKEFAHYYWFKDGQLIDFPGNQDDTLKSIILKSTHGNGAYSLIVAGYDNCRSLPTDTKYVYFNNDAPVTISPPLNFTSETKSPSTISLTWIDGSTDEGGFEIWRQKVSSSDTSRWEMAGIAPADATTFDDQNLFPSTLYHYKIRGISILGRSVYNPLGVNEFLMVTTSPDTEAPTVPQNLSAEKIGVKKIRLTWKPSVDNASVQEYAIKINDTLIRTGVPDTTHLFENLDLNKVYSFTVSSVDFAKNTSSESNRTESDTYLSGLYYEHSTGAWTDLSSIDFSHAEFSGSVADFSLSPKTQDDLFNFLFDGYLFLEKGGVYQFRTTSDDGSRLRINDSLIVDNDGLHNFLSVASPVQIFEAGPQRITVEFFDYSGSDSLLVEYKGPDSNNEWMKIPTEKLNSHTITSVPEESEEMEFQIFPNPSSSGEINIRLAGNSGSPTRVTVIDALGSKKYEQEFNAQIENTISINPPLYPGIYIIRVSHGKKSGNAKVLISN